MKWVKSVLTIILVGASLLANVANAAEPTLHEIYQTAESGDLKTAQSMLDRVLRDHPNSAKAHFVEAELLAREGKSDMARAELGTAERLAPGLPFAKPDSVNALRQRLLTSSQPAPTVLVSSHSAPTDFPWLWIVGGSALLGAFVYFLRSLYRPVAPSPAGAYTTTSTAFGAPFPQSIGAGGIGPIPSAPGGIGSGLLGSLATGAAVGAGIAAGETLMHKVLGGGQSLDHRVEQNGFQPIDSVQPVASNFDMGGSDFGVTDGGAWDDAGSGTSSDEW